MKEKKPACFGNFKKAELTQCQICKFALPCYFEWARKEKMRKAEERRSAPKNMKFILRERKPFLKRLSGSYSSRSFLHGMVRLI